jgi:predicted transposase YbfD/YdcC
VLSGLLIGAEIILFHELIEEKSNEIPAVQKMLKELDLWDVVYTLDAMRCQKKRSK